ncbi:MAG TPA: hypothetical protein VF339_11785 [Gammaproteobacteria bacterium]
MPRQQHEARSERPIAEAFAALVAVVARGRWNPETVLGPPDRPPAGMRYVQQRGSVLRTGRVVECIRPVSITLHETLDDSPCRVELKLRWRLEPTEAGSALHLTTSYELKGAAPLRRHHWDTRIRAHCGRMIDAWRTSLASAEGTPQDRRQEVGSSGQKTGSSSIAVTKQTIVNGSPTFR